MIDLNSEFFASKVLVMVSSDPQEQAIKSRKNLNFAKLLQLTNFDHIFDKHLGQSDSIHQLLETQKINELSQRADDEKVLMVVCYVGNGIWRNNSLYTMNKATGKQLDIENCLRTCASMRDVYVLGLFDCYRIDDGYDKTAQQMRSSNKSNLITVYRGVPNY